jgi:hypothetical protein
MNSPASFTVAGRKLVCPHCQHTEFYIRDSQLNTAGMEFLDLAWLNRSARNYICAGCGRIEWFLNPRDSRGSSLAEPVECLSCRATIPPGESRCPSCGWTYEDDGQD